MGRPFAVRTATSRGTRAPGVTSQRSGRDRDEHGLAARRRDGAPRVRDHGVLVGPGARLDVEHARGVARHAEGVREEARRVGRHLARGGERPTLRVAQREPHARARLGQARVVPRHAPEDARRPAGRERGAREVRLHRERGGHRDGELEAALDAGLVHEAQDRAERARRVRGDGQLHGGAAVRVHGHRGRVLGLLERGGEAHGHVARGPKAREAHDLVGRDQPAQRPAARSGERALEVHLEPGHVAGAHARARGLRVRGRRRREREAREHRERHRDAASESESEHA
ncbi:MAG: hypothetical protein M5U28_19990 [Sandaracinaceae bacterium]|nr:hypothetical protein [Sandaracinaceae bacterium]